MARTTDANKPKVLISTGQVAGLFRQNFKRGPWPKEFQCYHLRNDINVVRNAEPAKVLNNDESYRRRRAIISSVQKLIREQREYAPFPGLRFLEQIEAADQLDALEKALERARPALMGPFDPIAGERRGAAWHKPARFIARRAKTALMAAGHKKVSVQKHGDFVAFMVEAMVLAGDRRRTPEAMAAALRKPTN
jgi:hypothetical protein